MFGKIIKYVLSGIAWGCTISTVIGMIGVAVNGEAWLTDAPRGFIAQSFAAMIVGIAWLLPSMIYKNEKLSLAQQTLIHFSIAFVVYIPCAFYMGWIPSDGGIGQIITEIIIIVASSFVVWLVFCFYYRQLAKRMNERIRKIIK